MTLMRAISERIPFRIGRHYKLFMGHDTRAQVVDLGELNPYNNFRLTDLNR
jgi:hypothetical protein